MIVWPLNTNNFTLSDRHQIANFILDEKNRWTQSVKVQDIEDKMSKFIGIKYAIFVSSGSSANTLLAQYFKDRHGTDKKFIVLPSTTWQTSCSPWIREGYEPLFVDIQLKDFCINEDMLISLLDKYNDSIAAIFPTSLIGFVPNVTFYQDINRQYGIPVMMDNCENTLGLFDDKNISSYFTSTTSTYFGHQIQSIEGGFVFTSSLEEYEHFLMLRNHGMTRSLDTYGISKRKFINHDVDQSFDFYCLGSNYRNSDLNAFIGSLDLCRVNHYQTRRIQLYSLYKNLLDQNRFYLPSERSMCQDVPFCLPIIAKDFSIVQKAMKFCYDSGIEYRPIISGFLGKQTCYKQIFNRDQNTDRSYSNSEFLHTNGFYIGLYPALEEEKIEWLCESLNAL